MNNKDKKPDGSSYSFATFPNKASRLLESLKQSPEYEESFFQILHSGVIDERVWGNWANLLLI